MLLLFTILILIGISPFRAMPWGQPPAEKNQKTGFGHENYSQWLPRSFVRYFSTGIQPITRQYYGDDLESFKEGSYPEFDRAVSGYGNANDEDWIRVLDNQGSNYYGEGKNNDEKDGPDGPKGKEKKKSWFSRFWNGRPNSGKPSDPANYGISPHGQYPTDSYQKNGMGQSDRATPPIFARVRQYFGRMLKNSPGQRVKHD